MAKRGSIYFARRPPPTPTDPGGGVKMSKLTFSEHCHVAYQRESQMQQHGSK